MGLSDDTVLVKHETQMVEPFFYHTSKFTNTCKFSVDLLLDF